MKIIVENLAHAVTKDDLFRLFGVWGEVISVTIEEDKISGTPGGFVEMPDRQEALEAIEKITGVNLFGKPLKLSAMRDRADRRYDDGRRSSDERRETNDRRNLLDRRNTSENIEFDNRRVSRLRRTGLDRRDMYERRIKPARRTGADRR